MKLYARLFSKILSSSLMEEDIETRFLFITMILLANADGIVDMPLSALARAANMSENATRVALDQLMAPDPDSGCRDEEGRRLVPLDPGRERGWRIPSWAEHQKVFTEAHERELGRRRAAKFRAKKPPENPGAVTLNRYASVTGRDVSRSYTSTSSPPLPPPPGTDSSGGISAFGAAAASRTHLDAALGYAKGGLPVLPVRDRGKAPLIRKGVHGATTAASKLKGWWKRWPTANVGIATGPALFVLDVDGGDGETTLKHLEAKHGPLPETLEVRTGGGRHLYFKGDPRLRNTTGKLGPRLDTKAAGGFVVAPPSVHESGAVYAFTNQGTPQAIVPEWIVELVTRRFEKVATPKTPAGARAVGYAEAALDSAYETVKAASIGERNSTLYHQADGLGQLVAGGGLTREKAAGRLLDAAVANGIPPEEARATIESGFKAGAKNPRKGSTTGERHG